MSEKPRFADMPERKKANWLMARCHKAWFLTRHNGSVTVACDLTTPDGRYYQFETTMPDRQAALVHACERVYALRKGAYPVVDQLAWAEMRDITDRWFRVEREEETGEGD